MNISPSIRKFNERFYFSGKYISDEELYDLLIEVEKVNKNQNITFHEFICVCFFLAASRKKSDVNILEAGLFFRLDASNVLEKNIASIITPIGIDHKDFLKTGTIDEIIYEKCSHLLNNSKIFISQQKQGTLNKIKKVIYENSSRKFIYGVDYGYSKNDSGFTYKDKIGKLKLPYPNLLGNFQLNNISTAINVSRNIEGFRITEKDIKKAITKIRSEGRLQIIKKGKLKKYISNDNEILIDGAHNTLAASVIKDFLKDFYRKKKIIMILGMMANKEHKDFIKIFKKKIHSIIAVDIPNQVNFIKKEKLMKIAKSYGISSSTENSIEEAFKNASKQSSNALILCTGSLYFAGEILNLN